MAKWKEPMSATERGENLVYEGYEFPSDRERAGFGYCLKPPPYTEEEQFKLLAGGEPGASLGEAITIYCEGRHDYQGPLFTITQSQYLKWARSMPIERFVRIDKAYSDGYYLLKQGKTWTLYFADRGCVDICEEFASINDAKEYVIRHLSPMDVFCELSNQEDESEHHEPEMGTWQRFWSLLLGKFRQ